MALRGREAFVSIDRGSVCAGAVRSDFSGSRLHSIAVGDLAAGVVEPRPFEPNVSSSAALARAITSVMAQAHLAGAVATLVLSDAVARTALLRPPRDVKAEDYARFRLSQGLPYAPHEAAFGTLQVGGDAVLAAAIRRSIVAEYEAAMALAGVEVASVEMAAFVALHGLRGTATGSQAIVDVVLGDAAVSFAASDARGVRAFRTRRRGVGDDSAWIAGEIARTAAAASASSFRARVVGRGASALADRLKEAAIDAQAEPRNAGGGLVVPPCEIVWAGARV